MVPAGILVTAISFLWKDTDRLAGLLEQREGHRAAAPAPGEELP